jgi:hypothetical protein
MNQDQNRGTIEIVLCKKNSRGEKIGTREFLATSGSEVADFYQRYKEVKPRRKRKNDKSK